MKFNTEKQRGVEYGTQKIELRFNILYHRGRRDTQRGILK